MYFYPLREYLRPWKLITLALGLLFLLLGAKYSGLPDWDIPVSILMALPAYATAAPTMQVLLERRWRHGLTAALWTWFTVDGIYCLYWFLVDPEMLMFRPANAAASLALYLACGLVWYPRRPVLYDDAYDWIDEDQYH